MDYKAFVSSTFLDLKDHRAHVIRELRKAGFFVDPMEEWPSAAQEPKLLSTNRLDGSTLCVLMVARRRGHVPDGETRSITQLEVEAARQRGIDTWPLSQPHPASPSPNRPAAIVSLLCRMERSIC